MFEVYQSEIRAQFVLGCGPSSAAIKWFGGGEFSHVDLMLPNANGNLLGARSDAVGGQPPGVRIRPPNYEKWKKCVRFSLPCTPSQATRFYSAAIAQVGKAYDKTAIWGFAAGRDWRDSHDWFCSELFTFCLERSGRIAKLYQNAAKIFPGEAANIMSSHGAIATAL